jgi:hypothetical protein
MNNRNKIVFYDAGRNRYVTLTPSETKDRGQLMYHFKASDYHIYIDKKQTKVMNFRDWYWHYLK